MATIEIDKESINHLDRLKKHEEFAREQRLKQLEYESLKEKWKKLMIKIFGTKVITYEGDAYLFRDKLYIIQGNELRQSKHYVWFKN